MSTRSGKRIHNSFHENNIEAADELAIKSERKTRSKRLKGNIDNINATITISKKRKNYVKYPSDDELTTEVPCVDEVDGRNIRVLRRKALKEQNMRNEVDNIESSKKNVRIKRSNKKLSEGDTEKNQEFNENEAETGEIAKKPKARKNKKKVTEVLNVEVEIPLEKSKKNRRKKPSSLILEDIVPNDVSVDSFYSAASSPDRELSSAASMHDICKNSLQSKITYNIDISSKSKKNPGNLNSTFDTEESKENIRSTILQKSKSHKKLKKKSCSNEFWNEQDATFEKDEINSHLDTNSKSLKNITEASTSNNINTTYEKEFNDFNEKKQDLIFDKENDLSIHMSKKKKRKLLDTTSEAREIVENTTPPVQRSSKRKSVINTTFDKNGSITENNSIFEIKSDETTKTQRKRNSVFDTTYEKGNKTSEQELYEFVNKSNKNSEKDKTNTSIITENNILLERKKNVANDKYKTPANKSALDQIKLSSTNEKNSFDGETNGTQRKSVSRDTTFEKSNSSLIGINNVTFEKESDHTIKTKKKNSFNNQNLSKGELLLLQNSTEVNSLPCTQFDQDYVEIKEENFHKDITFEKEKSATKSNNTTFDKDSDDKVNERRKSILQRSDTTFEKDKNIETAHRKCLQDTTFEKEKSATTSNNTIFEKDSDDKVNKRRKSILQSDTTFEKDKSVRNVETTHTKCIEDTTFEKGYSETPCNNATFDMDPDDKPTERRKSILRRNSTEIEITIERANEKTILENIKRTSNAPPIEINPNETFEKCSLISSDGSTASINDNGMLEVKIFNNISSISITSDESLNIINSTPVLVESSINDTLIKSPQTPLKREGTFTKDSPEVTEPTSLKLFSMSPKVTPKRQKSLPSAGCTPFHLSGTKKISKMNVTRSIEKDRRSSVDLAPKVTKVMFCSPVFDPVVASQHKRKIIKSNLKGSNKTFVYEEYDPSPHPASRKRSYTQSDVEDTCVKRTHLANCQQQSVDRLSRPRTCSASAKLTEPVTPSKKTPQKAKPEAKVTRTKLPNFAALHQKQFDRMESLDECQVRKAKRAKHLLTPTGTTAVLERSSPKVSVPDQQKQKEPNKSEANKTTTFKFVMPGYTRFGFKLDTENNPFNPPRKTDNATKAPKIMPSLAGSTTRKEVAKQVVMREKSFTDRRANKRKENRTIIKGVRTNRRFELQMKLRNIN